MPVHPCHSGNCWTQSRLDVNRARPEPREGEAVKRGEERRRCWVVSSVSLRLSGMSWLWQWTPSAAYQVQRGESTPPKHTQKKSVFMTGRRWAEDGQGCCSVLSTDCYWELVCLYSPVEHNTSWLITPGCHWLLLPPLNHHHIRQLLQFLNTLCVLNVTLKWLLITFHKDFSQLCKES